VRYSRRSMRQSPLGRCHDRTSDQDRADPASGGPGHRPRAAQWQISVRIA
jgi:hypothetical protein